MKEVNLLAVIISVVGKRKKTKKLTELYRQHYQLQLCLRIFISLFSASTLAGKMIVCMPSQGINRETVSYKIQLQRIKFESGGK